MAKRKTDEELIKAWKRRRGGFGRLRLLPSGRLQASFKGPDGVLHKAPQTFEFDFDTARAGGDGAHLAEAWLYEQKQLIRHAELTGQVWKSPSVQRDRSGMTVENLAKKWLSKDNKKITKDSTRQKHMQYLNLRVLCDSRPGFDSLKDVLVTDVDRNRIELWWNQIEKVWPDTGSTNAFAYKRLHTAFNYAVKEKIIDVNPVNVDGAGEVPKSDIADRPVIKPEEAHGLVKHIRPRLKAPVAVLLWCGLRIGELLELRRSDITVVDDTVTISVSRNAQPLYDNETGKYVMRTLGSPKTEDGNRKIVVPKFAVQRVIDHLAEYVDDPPDSFFVTTGTGNRMFPSHFRRGFADAAKAVGRPDITTHDCRRHYGTMLLRTGIPFDEARRLMGHKTIQQLMEYQRADSDYRAQAARKLDTLLGHA